MSLPPVGTSKVLFHAQQKWTNFGLKYAKIGAGWGAAVFACAMFFGQPRKQFEAFFSWVPPPFGPYFKKQYNPKVPYLNPILV